MVILPDGYFTDIGTIWSTCCSCDGVRIFYMETEQVYTGNLNDRVRPRLQEVGRYNYQINRPTEKSTNGTETT